MLLILPIDGIIISIGGESETGSVFFSPASNVNRSSTFQFLQLPDKNVFYGKLGREYPAKEIYNYLDSCLGRARFQALVVSGEGQKSNPYVFNQFRMIGAEVRFTHT